MDEIVQEYLNKDDIRDYNDNILEAIKEALIWGIRKGREGILVETLIKIIESSKNE